jgi:chromosome segregation ATPase
LETRKKHLTLETSRLSADQKKARESLKSELELHRTQQLKKLEEDSKPLKQELDDLQQGIKNLKSARGSINKDIEVAKDQLSCISSLVSYTETVHNKLQSSIETSEKHYATSRAYMQKLKQETVVEGDKLSNIESSIEKRKLELQLLEEDILAHQRQLDDLQADYEMRRKVKDDELKSILIRVGDALARLRQLQSDEKVTRESIAADQLTLDREREVLARREAKISDSEGRIAKHTRLMRL